MKKHRRFLITLVAASTFQVLVLCPALAAPRPPQPSLPEFVRVTCSERFDGPYTNGATAAEMVVSGMGTLRESWSGYSLERVGEVVPFLIPGMDGNGDTNLTGATGAVRLWVKPYWSSATTGEGNGPGHVAQLLEMSVVGTGQSFPVWSLQVSANGSVISLLGAGEKGSGVLLQAGIAWQAGEWHQVILNRSEQGTALILDGELVAEGAGVLAVPPPVAALTIASSLVGAESFEGEIEEVYCFVRPLNLAFHYAPYKDVAAQGAMSAEEAAAVEAARAKREAERAALGESDGGGIMLRLVGDTSECITNQPLYITNTICVFDTNQGWTVQFDVQGTNATADIFTTTNLIGNNITNSQWVWLERGPSCSTYQYTNQPSSQSYYILGTTNDTDADGLTDAYEKLVSKTLVSLNDTDGDGWLDSEEVFLGMNPLVADPSKPTIIVTASVPTASEAATNYGSCLFTRTGSISQAGKAYFSIGGTGSIAIDYDSFPISVSFSPGQSNAVVLIQPIDDLEFEGNETVVLSLLPSIGYVIGTSSNATVTILDNDLPTVSVIATDANAAESGNNSGQFLISAPIPLSVPLTVNFQLSGTATNGADYSLIGTNVVIPAGTNSILVTIAPINNTNYTGPRIVQLNLKTNASYLIAANAGTAVLTITDDELPTVQVFADDPDAREGSPVRDGRFKFLRNATLNESLNVSFSIHGTAIPGADYDGLASAITIPAGTNAAYLTVHPIDDSEGEIRETVIAVLRGGPQFNIGMSNLAKVLIDDNEPATYSWELTKATAVSWAANTYMVPAELVVRRTGSTLTDERQIIRVTSGGAMNNGIDYAWGGDFEKWEAPYLPALNSEVRVLWANRSSEARIQVNKNTTLNTPVNTNTFLQIYVTNLFTTNYQTIFFHGVDRLFSVNFLTNQIAEGGASVTLRLSRPDLGYTGPIWPDFDLVFQVNGIARSGIDHTLTNLTNNIPGNLDTVDIPVQAFSDGLSEGWESVYVRLDPLNPDYSPDTRAGQNWVAAANIRDPGVTGTPAPLDNDGDGMTDDFEQAYGENPFVFDDPYVDTDGDGMPDLEESLAGTNPNSRDSDSDGLDDYTEWTHGSNPTDASQNTLLSPDNYAPVKLAVASCYKCHQTTLSAGQYQLTSVPPVKGHTADSTRLEQIFQFVKGASYPIHISGPVTGDSTGSYTAEILVPTNGVPPGFILDDTNAMLGVERPVSTLGSKVANLIVPKVEIGGFGSLKNEYVNRDDQSKAWADRQELPQGQPLYAGEHNGDMVSWKANVTPTNILPRVTGYNWVAEGPATNTGPSGTNIEWRIDGNDFQWLPGHYTIRCTVSIDGTPITTGLYEQDVGTRTEDVLVIGWINGGGVTLVTSGVQATLMNIFPPTGISPDADAYVKFNAAYLVKLLADGQDTAQSFEVDPYSPANGGTLSAFSAADKTYAIGWMFKFASNPPPPLHFTNSTGVNLVAINNFRTNANKTLYKLFNHFQVKSLVDDKGKFKTGSVVPLQHEAEIGTTKDPTQFDKATGFWSVFAHKVAASEGYPSDGEFVGVAGTRNSATPVTATAETKLCNEGTPDNRALAAFKAINGFDQGQIWSSITFFSHLTNYSATISTNSGQPLTRFAPTRVEQPRINTQVYPTYWIYLNGEKKLEQNQNLSPGALFPNKDECQ